MSEIVKTEAIVLTKIDFGDTSNIFSLFTKEFGKISAILKGGKKGRGGKSNIVDPPNHLDIIIYKKASREVQLISGAEMISHYPGIKDNYERLKYAYAVIELIKRLLPEHEPNHKIFRGVVRIFDLLETTGELPAVVFGRFFMFFLKEIGYGIQLDRCASCGKTNIKGSDLSYNYEIGILCTECGEGHLNSFSIDAELFRYLVCLKDNITVEYPGDKIPQVAVSFFERFLKYHIPDFPGIQTFQIFK